MKRKEQEIAALLGALCRNGGASLAVVEDGRGAGPGLAGRRRQRVSRGRVRELLARGLLAETEEGNLVATEAGAAWLRRWEGGTLPFRRQHDEIGTIRVDEENRSEVLVSLDESPVAMLARRKRGSGKPWLPAHAATAAERLRRDFEIGGLQPRVTANWSASVSDSRRSGDNSGLKDLTDTALAARQRFDRAVRAVGPELSGVMIDVCCFVKGLETVEHERQWPARSAKLVLRLALERLARHYGLMPSATGRAGAAELRHWGAEDYRPKIG